MRANLAYPKPPVDHPWGQSALGQERLPGDERGRDEIVVGRVGAGRGDRAEQRVLVELEGVGMGQARPQRLRERLGVGRRAQSRLTAAAPARIRMIPPYPM